MSVEVSNSGFSKWRSFLWPIHTFELKKVLPMLLMFFCISFNYSILRNAKDALIVTAPGSGAEVIPFIKLWLIIPAAILFLIIYSKLSNKLSKSALFYTMISPFLIFFGLFAYLIYPHHESLHPTALADKLQSVLPSGLQGLVAILRNWTYAVFYVFAELWGSVMLSLMFWGFANEITRVGEAKRFYTLFGIGANLALITAGPITIFASNICHNVPEGVDPWGASLKFLLSLVFASGLIIMACYWWIGRYVLSDARFYDASEEKKRKEKPRMSLKESFIYLAKSPYILALAVLVISYGIAINIVEVTWKNQLKLQFPKANDYNGFMGYFSTLTGIVTVLMMLFVGGNVIRRFGWKVGALFTPIVLLASGILFFALVLYQDQLSGVIAWLGTTPLMLTVLLGTFQNIMSKSCKYSLFDPTKEMAYIPLDQEQKVKGKAAIDVVGARLGKAGGSLMQQGLLIFCGSFSLMTPYLGVILLVIIVAWIAAVRIVDKRFSALTEQRAGVGSDESSLKQSA